MTLLFLTLWSSTSIVLMLLPNGLKMQGGFAVIAFGACCLLICKRRFSVRNHKVIGLFGLLFFLLYLSALWSQDIERTMYELLKITPGVLGFLVVTQLLTGRRSLQKLSWVFVCTAIITVLFAAVLILKFGSLRGYYRGVTELKGISGMIGSYAAMFVPVGTYLVLAERSSWKRISWWLLSTACVNLVIISGTRAAFAALLVSLMFLSTAVIMLRVKFVSLLIVLLLFSLSVPFAFHFLPFPAIKQELSKRVTDVPIAEGDAREITVVVSSGQRRAQTWSKAIEVYSENPFLGIGFEAFSRKFWFTNPHNIVLDFILAAGLPGLFSLGTICCFASWGYWKGLKRYRKFDKKHTLLCTSFAASYLGLIIFGLFWQLLWHPFFYILSAVGLYLFDSRQYSDQTVTILPEREKLASGREGSLNACL